MARHLWELFLPAYDGGTRQGLARYGLLIDHFDFARIKGRLYLKTCFVQDPDEIRVRGRAAEHAVASKLWRRDRAHSSSIQEDLRQRLLELSKIDPTRMAAQDLFLHIVSLRQIFN